MNYPKIDPTDFTPEAAMWHASEKQATAREILDATAMLDYHTKTLKVWRADKMGTITGAMKEDGKPLYSNDAARQAALASMEAADGLAQDLGFAVVKAQGDIEAARLRLSYLTDRLAIILAFAPIMTGEAISGGFFHGFKAGGAE